MEPYEFISDDGVSIYANYAPGTQPMYHEESGVTYKRVVEPIAHQGGELWHNGRIQHSLANGVHPSQIEDAKKLDAQLGVPIKYRADGRATFSSRSEKNTWLKAHGRVDHDAGYSDPAPGDFKGNLIPEENYGHGNYSLG